MRKTALAALIAGALTLLACNGAESSIDSDGTATGTGDKAAVAPSPVTAKKGGTLTVKANGVTAAWTLVDTYKSGTDQFGIEPDNGGDWFLVKVKVEVKDGREAYVCSCDLSIVAPSGKVYDQGFATFKGKPDLTGASVAPGQNTDGWVVFGVPTGDLKGARLQLKQQSLLDDTAFGYWAL